MLKPLLKCVVLGALALAACTPLAEPTDIPTLVPTAAPPTHTPAATTATEPAASATPASTATEAEPQGEAIGRLSAGQVITITTINMLTDTSGWAVAETESDQADHLVRTSDGGATWRDVTPPQPLDAAAELGQGATLFALDAETAWATYYDRTGGPLSAPAFVWRTSDGGATWQAGRPLDTTDIELYQPSDLIFVDASHGWLMAHVGAGMSHDYVAIFRTADGGETWERLVDPYTEALPQSCGKTGMVFTDASNGWVTGDCMGVVPGAPYLQRTTDGGRTWQTVELPPPAQAPELFTSQTTACGVQSPAYFDPRAGLLPVVCFDYESGRVSSFLYSTLNGGQDWEMQAVPDRYNTAYFLNPETGWILTGELTSDSPHDLYITADSGETLRKAKTVNWLGQFSFVSPQVGWAVAESAEGQALVKTTDGGQTWQIVTPQIAA